MEMPSDHSEQSTTNEKDELLQKISKLVVQGFINNGDSSKDALLELEAMGINRKEIDDTMLLKETDDTLLLSEIVTKFLNQLEEKNG